MIGYVYKLEEGFAGVHFFTILSDKCYAVLSRKRWYFDTRDMLLAGDWCDRPIEFTTLLRASHITISGEKRYPCIGKVNAKYMPFFISTGRGVSSEDIEWAEDIILLQQRHRTYYRDYRR